MSIASIK